MDKKIWFDFTNPPHVNLFYPLIQRLSSEGYLTVCTAKEFVETSGLLSDKGIDYKLLGKHGGGSKLKKAWSLLDRVRKLSIYMKDFDVSISSNYEAPLVSWLKGKKAIIFDDNDISPNWMYSRFADYVICPEVIDREAMINMGVKAEKLISYKGYKEDIYIASYSPDENFLSQLPFINYVVVRPENIKATYVPRGVKSIVPELINLLTRRGINVLYLPRYDEDRSYAKNGERVFIPDKPLSGLDVCFYSDAVLTGAGTFSREAALMGKTAVSFFAGKKFLSVDRHLIEQKAIYFSRNPHGIVDYLKSPGNPVIDPGKSKEVQAEVFQILEKIID